MSQDYPRIELIISDDCSKDDTIDKCLDWILKYKDHFDGCRVIKSEKNTGVTANCNRACRGIRGEYLKLLAADDLLAPNAISEFVNYMLSNPTAVYVFSRVTVFGGNQDTVAFFTSTVFDYSFFTLQQGEQYKWLIGHWFQPIPAASCFINVSLALDSGVLYYDERIPMLEDWPKWIVLSEKGIVFHFIDKELVKYRVSDTSICSGEKYKSAFKESRALLYLLYQYRPSIKLFGLRRAIYFFVIYKAVINDSVLWKLLSKIVKRIMIIRNKIKML